MIGKQTVNTTGTAAAPAASASDTDARRRGYDAASSKKTPIFLNLS